MRGAVITLYFGMSGPFDRDFDRRREWWDQRLWLQMIVIAAIALVAVIVVYGLSVSSIVGAAACVLVVYVLARALLASRRP